MNFYGSCEFTRSNVQLTKNHATNKKTQKLKVILQRIQAALSRLTVEPCIMLYMLSIAISSLAVQNMNLEKACRVNCAYGDQTCDLMIAGNTTELKEELVIVQSLVARAVAWKFPLQTAIPAIMVLFVGAWSDRTRKRKICILSPMLGQIIKNIGLLLATYYMNEWSLETTALIEALPPALTGDSIILFMGMYSYMTDITTPEERTLRLGVVTVFITLGTPVGNALSGILLHELGYYGIFSLMLCLDTMSLTYGLIRLKDVKSEKPKQEGGGCKIFFAWKSVADTMQVVFKQRLGTRRFQIFSVMLLYFLMVGPLYGDSQVGYLYARYKFNFSEVEYSLFGAFNTMIGICGTIFCMSILVKLLGIEDSAIGVLAGVSRIASSLIFAFAPDRVWYYSAAVINIFSHVGLTIVRSISSKLVPNHEVAKLSSMLGVCEALAPSVYMPVTSSIYIASLKTLPGAFYLFDASLTAVAVTFFSIIFCIKRRERNPDSNEKEFYARSNEITRL